MPFLDVNGTRIHYEDTGGPGEPIVFSHGLLWSGDMFSAQVEALRGQYRCITYDHRCQGRSPYDPTPFDMEVLAEDALALLSALDLPPCHFAGLSMGGFVGLRLAARHPSRLRSLLLLASAADREPLLNIPKYRAMAFLAERFSFQPLVPVLMKIMFANAFLTDPHRHKLRKTMEDHLSGLHNPSAQLAVESVLTRRGVEDELHRIPIPTLLVHGAEDTAVVLKRAVSTAQRIPDCRISLIPNAGHTLCVEEPERLNRAIFDFLQLQKTRAGAAS